MGMSVTRQIGIGRKRRIAWEGLHSTDRVNGCLPKSCKIGLTFEVRATVGGSGIRLQLAALLLPPFSFLLRSSHHPPTMTIFHTTL